MKKRNSLFLLPLAALCCCAPLPISSLSSSLSSSSSSEPLPTFEYEDLYMKNTDKRPDNTSSLRYASSDGYYSNSEQGYNHFYYLAKHSSGDEYMDFQNGKFVHEGASLDLDVMTSSGGYLATRKFVSPVSGSGRINGQFRSLVAGNLSRIDINLNDSLIGSQDTSSTVGVYLSIPVTLKVGDSLSFVLASSGSASCNPTIDLSGKEEPLLHQSIDGQYGDVHPFYDEENKRMVMYYLSTGNEQHSVHEQFSTLATASSDLVHYTQLPLTKNVKNPPSISTYYALGVYKDANGTYRSPFGCGSFVGCSKSVNLTDWENGEEVYVDESTSTLGYHYRVNFGADVFSGRDPEIFYDVERQTYYCIVMNYYASSTSNGKKGLAIYSGNREGDYSTSYYKALDCTGRGDPECPQILKANNRYYIFYSIYGTGTSGNVGQLAYRIGDEGKAPTEVKWDEKNEYYLDGGDLHAAQICVVEDKIYVYGWMTSVPSVNSWGGSLSLTKEVIVQEDGTLGSRIDPCYKNLLDKGLIHEFSAFGTESFLNAPRSILKASFSLGSNAAGGFRVLSNGTELYVGVISTNGKPVLAITPNVSQPRQFVYLELNEVSATYDLDVYLDGGFIDAVVNDHYALSSRVSCSSTYDVSCFQSGNAAFSKGQIHKLADLSNVLD